MDPLPHRSWPHPRPPARNRAPALLPEHDQFTRAPLGFVECASQRRHPCLTRISLRREKNSTPEPSSNLPPSPTREPHAVVVSVSSRSSGSCPSSRSQPAAPAQLWPGSSRNSLARPCSFQSRCASGRLAPFRGGEAHADGSVKWPQRRLEHRIMPPSAAAGRSQPFRRPADCRPTAALPAQPPGRRARAIRVHPDLPRPPRRR